MLRQAILAASRSGGLRRAVETAPVSRSVVQRFVAGASVEDAVRAARQLAGEGLLVSLDHLGEDTRDAVQAEATAEAYLVLLDRLHAADLTRAAEVSVKLSALGQVVDPELAHGLASRVCAAAAAAGTTVTIDMEDHTTTDRTLGAVRRLRQDHPWLGAVVQSYLHRTEADCRDLAGDGSRVRLCKGAYREPPSVAYQERAEVDASYARCLGVLMSGSGYPMVASHDPALIALAQRLAAEHGRERDSWELQMLLGVRPDEQRRLAAAGHRVRVYVPYGGEWYGYLMRRMAERPANLAFFLRALATRS